MSRSSSRVGITEKQFAGISAEYVRSWGLPICAIDPNGQVVFGKPHCEAGPDAPCRAARRDCLDESVRWGEPTVLPCPRNCLIWAVPLMHNARVLGGLVAHAEERRVFPHAASPAALDVRLAVGDLRRLAERENLTNSDFLAARRHEYRREQLRAEALHLSKLGSPDVRQLYLQHEPALMAAIRRDDRPAARSLLNEILTAICFVAGRRTDLAKSFFMELVVMMGRTAVEVGGPGHKLLEASLERIAELSGLDDEEALAGWLRRSLEEVMDAIGSAGVQSDRAVAEALHYMGDHLGDRMGRGDVASAVGLSNGYFSRRFHAEMGQPFSIVLRQMRTDRAAELLVRSDTELSQIALQCGFTDQSYFSRVFRELTGLSPGHYRAKYRPRD
jgi:AraC-like DNA-binding protein